MAKLGGEEDRAVADLLDGKQRTHEREEQRWPAGNGGEGQLREQDKMMDPRMDDVAAIKPFWELFLETVGECDIFPPKFFWQNSKVSILGL